VRPEISVVVPTHNRPAGLATVVAALKEQTVGSDRFDVIVVDDGSDQPQQVDADGIAARVVRHEQARGPAAARNSGWRAAQAPVVAFVDDDCAPSPRWLEAILGAADGSDSVVVQGPVGPPPDERAGITPLTHTIEVGGPSRLFVSCNIAFSRALLERTGGFDESFKRACGEDVELGARIEKAGAQVCWADDALVHHEVRPLGLAGVLRQTLKWTDSVRTLSMHPELRELLTARVFWKPTHPLLLLAGAGVATRRPLIAAVAAAPYVRHYRRVHGGSVGAAARWLPVHLAIDATEVGTAVAGSIRHRTLML
jgi:glycosyltransferase involved in cell wall biosynthesis